MIYEQLLSEMITEIDKTIRKIADDDITKEFVERNKISGNLFECSKLSVWGTQYKIGQYVLLRNSTMEDPIFGKIVKLLCSLDQAYLMCQKTSNSYSPATDLFFVNDENLFEVIPSCQLAAYHPLESYLVSEADLTSISLRHYVLQHLNE